MKNASFYIPGLRKRQGRQSVYSSPGTNFTEWRSLLLYDWMGRSSCRTHGNAIIGTQEIVKDASTRDRALSSRARRSITEPGHQQARSPAPDRRRLHVHVYAPPKQYMLALKILAGREKDMADCRMLLPQTHIRTRKQAQRVLDRYILPDAQKDEAETIEYSLNVLFGSESKGEP